MTAYFPAGRKQSTSGTLLFASKKWPRRELRKARQRRIDRDKTFHFLLLSISGVFDLANYQTCLQFASAGEIPMLWFPVDN